MTRARRSEQGKTESAKRTQPPDERARATANLADATDEAPFTAGGPMDGEGVVLGEAPEEARREDRLDLVEIPADEGDAPDEVDADELDLDDDEDELDEDLGDEDVDAEDVETEEEDEEAPARDTATDQAKSRRSLPLTAPSGAPVDHRR
jgi:hypothetical protein